MKVAIILNFISGGISIYPDKYKSGSVADIFEISPDNLYDKERLDKDIIKKYGSIEVKGVKYQLTEIKKSPYDIGNIAEMAPKYHFSLIYTKYKEPYIDYNKSIGRLLEVTSILVGQKTDINSISDKDLKTQYIPAAVKIIKAVDDFIKDYDKENK